MNGFHLNRTYFFNETFAFFVKTLSAKPEEQAQKKQRDPNNEANDHYSNYSF